MTLAEIMMSIALWCGQPQAVVRNTFVDWPVEISSVQNCRQRILACMNTEKDKSKCFTANSSARLGK